MATAIRNRGAARGSKDLSALARGMFEAYVTKDRDYVEQLLSDDFVFSSPYDDRIDRATYFARCWPNSERINAFHIRSILAGANEVFVLYECVPKDGESFTNTEHLRFTPDGKLSEVQVFFGDPPSGVRKEDYAKIATRTAEAASH